MLNTTGLLIAALLLGVNVPQPAAAAGTIAPVTQLYAHVNANGAVISQHGVSAVTHPATGVYCVLPASSVIQNDVATGVVAPVITLDYTNTPDELVTVVSGGPNTNYCPSAGYMAVYSYYIAPGIYQPKDAAFILLYV
jgi:hypothetical protein